MGWFSSKTKEPAPEVVDVTSQVEALQREVDNLRDEKRDLQEKIEGLDQKHTLANERIAHNVKIREEQLDVAHQKELVKAEKKIITEVGKVKDEYRAKVEKNLHEQIERLDGKYRELLDRLPDINVALKGRLDTE